MGSSLIDYVADVENYIDQNYVSKELFDELVEKVVKFEEDFGDAIDKIQ